MARESEPVTHLAPSEPEQIPAISELDSRTNHRDMLLGYRLCDTPIQAIRRDRGVFVEKECPVDATLKGVFHSYIFGPREADVLGEFNHDRAFRRPRPQLGHLFSRGPVVDTDD